jgi:hypothetical protein
MEYKTRRGQAFKRASQRLIREMYYRSQQFVGKLSTYNSADLGNFFGGWAEAIEPRHQGGMESRRYCGR